ncbi:MAG: hypothetical protein M1816_006252 [Peltula sp. TS41687]|nr:MAG: hypothetical protein M1816_006252 [Peltula sp. TS41687]
MRRLVFSHALLLMLAAFVALAAAAPTSGSSRNLVPRDPGPADSGKRSGSPGGSRDGGRGGGFGRGGADDPTGRKRVELEQAYVNKLGKTCLQDYDLELGRFYDAVQIDKLSPFRPERVEMVEKLWQCLEKITGDSGYFVEDLPFSVERDLQNHVQKAYTKCVTSGRAGDYVPPGGSTPRYMTPAQCAEATTRGRFTPITDGYVSDTGAGQSLGLGRGSAPNGIRGDDDAAAAAAAAAAPGGIRATLNKAVNDFGHLLNLANPGKGNGNGGNAVLPAGRFAPGAVAFP